MSLANGRPYLAIPGPSVVPDRVLAAMHRPSPNIYGDDIHDMARSIFKDLLRIAGSTAHVAIYVTNGHGTWEAAIANLFSRGDKALLAVTGHFGRGWAEWARRMGVDVETVEFGGGAAIDATRIEEVLAADRSHRIRAVMMTHVDTASTVRNDIKAVRAAIDAARHPALLAVDAIASLGCEEILFDEWGIDVLIAASQKGLMLPPGLGFVWVSDKALETSRNAGLCTPYWDWKPRVLDDQFYRYFAGTAPTHHLFGLREALTMILDEEGLASVWRRHRVLAGAIWAAFETWGRGGDIALSVADRASRAHSVTGARIGAGGAARLRQWLESTAGVTLGIGLGMAQPGEPTYDDFLRVAHMGHVNAHMTLGALAAMEAGMRALAIPHGSGALDAAAAALVAEA
ncbi:aminotransferase class V-fold PLP-dependent enzyme [Chelativorans sp. AA-79]|uniref:pyridoxal-phosphate-dependent aminotransferase family protein n=1 Tax=Chelativorans sp. AA-79 TaxID=3028735 RepID=UPI0023FA1B58|nr:aminotransferase class V-fold PLP-dependent enzyme [Chelativorans sp. AA-79]WEX10499.1 aminotransferase class V-fold PLP-dependent enzyme [Chelativorans sp. AA-79]